MLAVKVSQPSPLVFNPSIAVRICSSQSLQLAGAAAGFKRLYSSVQSARQAPCKPWQVPPAALLNSLAALDVSASCSQASRRFCLAASGARLPRSAEQFSIAFFFTSRQALSAACTRGMSAAFVVGGAGSAGDSQTLFIPQYSFRAALQRVMSAGLVRFSGQLIDVR